MSAASAWSCVVQDSAGEAEYEETVTCQGLDVAPGAVLELTSGQRVVFVAPVDSGEGREAA